MPRANRLVRLLYFGGARDAVGKSEEELELPDDIRTIAELGEYLASTHPGLAGRLAGVRYAINEAFVDAARPIHEGDVVAVIPPVSGG